MTAHTDPQPQGPVDGPGSSEPMPRLTAVAMDPRHPLTQPPYPPGSIRDNEQGNADVEVYVLPNGRVGEARIVRSTGFERLDRAALEEARRYWRFTPATRDGTPVAWEDLVRGYEYQKGRFVVLTKDDFKAAAIEKDRRVQVSDFVPAEAIDRLEA